MNSPSERAPAPGGQRELGAGPGSAGLRGAQASCNQGLEGPERTPPSRASGRGGPSPQTVLPAPTPQMGTLGPRDRDWHLVAVVGSRASAGTPRLGKWGARSLCPQPGPTSPTDQRLGCCPNSSGGDLFDIAVFFLRLPLCRALC